MIAHLKVSGRVQGVGFRAFTRRAAEEAGVTGWVRNRIDCRVEIYAEGEKEAMEAFLDAVRKGPRFGKVTDIQPVCAADAPFVPVQAGIFFSAATV